jgi:ribosomal protein S20
VADRFERDAYSMLEGNPSESVNATIQTALRLISEARLNIENGDYSAARSNLSGAFSALDEAKEKAREDTAERNEENADDGDSGRNKESNEGENRGSSKDSDEDDDG